MTLIFHIHVIFVYIYACRGVHGIKSRSSTSRRLFRQVGKPTAAEKPVPTRVSSEENDPLQQSRAERRDRLRENTEQEKGDCWRRAKKEWRKKWRLDRGERGEYGTGTCRCPSWYFGIFARPSLSPLVRGDLNVRNQHHAKEQSFLLAALLPPPFALVFALMKLGGTIPRSEQKRPSAVSQYGTSSFQRTALDTSTTYTPCTKAPSPSP